MSANVKRGIKIVLLLFTILFILLILQKYFLVHYDEHKVRVDGFYMEDIDSLDVVFVGASDVYAGFSSAQAYGEYGFTSYPFAIGLNPVLFWKSQVKEINSRQSPKLIVIEVTSAICDDVSSLTDDPVLRRYIDNIPYSINKLDTINNCVSSENKLSFLFPIIKYHGNWTKPEKCIEAFENIIALKRKGYSLLRGANTCTRIELPSILKDITSDMTKSELNPELQRYLEDTLQYLRDGQNTRVLFVRFPHLIYDDDSYLTFQRANAVEDIIESYGFDYINLQCAYEEIGLDVTKDFYNAEHLNIRGQQKFTSYFANLLCSKYDVVASALTETQKKEWYNSYEYIQKYYNYTEGLIEENTDIELWEERNLIKKLNCLE